MVALENLIVGNNCHPPEAPNAHLVILSPSRPNIHPSSRCQLRDQYVSPHLGVVEILEYRIRLADDTHTKKNSPLPVRVPNPSFLTLPLRS